MQVAFFINIIEADKFERRASGRPSEYFRGIEHAMGVKENLGSRADWEADVKFTAGLKHSEEVGEAT